MACKRRSNADGKQKKLEQIVNHWIRQILISAVQLLDSIGETGEDVKVREFVKCVWVPEKLKSGLGYQGTLVSLSLPKTGASLRLRRYSG